MKSGAEASIDTTLSRIGALAEHGIGAATLKIKGLDKVVKQMEDISKAFEGLNGEFGSVSFNPHDPASIETAIQSVEAMIDERSQPYAANEIVAAIANEMKETYRQGIIEKAAKARLEGECR